MIVRQKKRIEPCKISEANATLFKAAVAGLLTLTGKSIYRQEVLDVRRNAWLGDSHIAPPKLGWAALVTSLATVSIFVLIVFTEVYTKYTWMQSTIVSRQLKQPWRTHETQDRIMLAVRSVRPDLLRTGRSISIKPSDDTKGGARNAVIRDCRSGAGNDAPSCAALHGPRDVLLTFAWESGQVSPILDGLDGLKLRLPTDEQHISDWFMQPGKLR